MHVTKFLESLLYTLGFLFHGWHGPKRTSGIYIPETNTMCNLPDVPEERRSFTVNGHTVCGGMVNEEVQNNCKAFNTTTGQWETSATFRPARYHHCSWLSSQGLYLMGGIETESSTTLIHNTGDYEEGFQLRNPFREACAISDPDTDTVIITGGWYGVYLSFVTRYNVDGFDEKLPTINVARNGHGCSSYLDSEGHKVKENMKISIIDTYSVFRCCLYMVATHLEPLQKT